MFPIQSTTLKGGVMEKKGKRAVWITLLIVFLLESAFSMLEAPRLRIFEQIIQQQSAANQVQPVQHHLTPDEPCHGEVQSELAIIVGWGDMLSAAADILAAFPFGLLADRYGRRHILRLNLAGILMSSLWVVMVMLLHASIPLRRVWMSAGCNLFGGGPTVTAALFFMIIADVSTEAQRLQYFSILAVAGLAGQVVGAPLSSAIMAVYTPWTAIYLASALLFAASCLSFFIPETRRAQPKTVSTEPQIVAGEKTPLISQFSPTCMAPLPRRRPAPRRSFIVHIMDKLSQVRRPFPITWPILILLSTFPLHVISRSSMKFLLQYITQRYAWTMADAGLINSIRAAVNILLLLLVLPILSQLLLGRLHYSSMRKDLTLAKCSMALLTLGSFGIAMSPNVPSLAVFLVVYTLGTGFALFVRSLATSFVNTDQIGRLYSVMTVLDALGQMAAGPLLAEIFGIGVKRGKSSTGLPFLAAGVLHASVLGLIYLVRLRHQEEHEHTGYILVHDPIEESA